MPRESVTIRIPGQDDDGIDLEGLRRQQLFAYTAGVLPEVADADHPEAFQAQHRAIGTPRRRWVGDVEVNDSQQPVHALARVDLTTGYQLNTGDSRAMPTRMLPPEVVPTDFSQVTVNDALGQEDLAEIAPGGAIDQIRKTQTTRLFHPIR
jgi:hypothetical protein